AGLGYALVANAEVMRDLVDDRVAHDLCLTPRRHGHPLDGPAEDADAVGYIWLLRAALGEGNAFVQTEQRSVPRHSLRRRLLLDHDLQIPDVVSEPRRQLVQGTAHEAREPRTPQVGHDRTVAVTRRTPTALLQELARASRTLRTRTGRLRFRSRAASARVHTRGPGRDAPAVRGRARR